MTSARKDKICLDTTSYYHCMSRCVRQSFLCGFDPVLEKNFDHRRGWIEKRILFLAEIFCINVPSYAVMHNHYHVILHVNKDSAIALSDLEVVRRWSTLCHKDAITKAYLNRTNLSEQHSNIMKKRIYEWRTRLYSISWFMKFMNEKISRLANKEENRTGCFWESRFKSQALLDEKALLACMAYVDLNPIRAKICEKPENAVHTSIFKRLERKQKPDQQLYSFGQGENCPNMQISINLNDYLELLRWTAHNIEKSLDEKLKIRKPKIINSYNFEIESWFAITDGFENEFNLFVGPHAAMSLVYANLAKKRIVGISNCKKHFGTGA